jgi:hypothetical protein
MSDGQAAVAIPIGPLDLRPISLILRPINSACGKLSMVRLGGRPGTQFDVPCISPKQKFAADLPACPARLKQLGQSGSRIFRFIRFDLYREPVGLAAGLLLWQTFAPISAPFHTRTFASLI